MQYVNYNNLHCNYVENIRKPWHQPKPSINTVILNTLTCIICWFITWHKAITSGKARNFEKGCHTIFFLKMKNMTCSVSTKKVWGFWTGTFGKNLQGMIGGLRFSSSINEEKKSKSAREGLEHGRIEHGLRPSSCTCSPYILFIEDFWFLIEKKSKGNRGDSNTRP